MSMQDGTLSTDNPDFYIQRQREAERQKQANDQAESASKARKETEKRLKEQHDAEIRQAKAAGVETHIDPASGTTQPTLRDDLTPVFKPKKLSNPYQDDKGSVVEDFRDDRGQVIKRPVETKIDSKTGDKFFETKDDFGQTKREIIGKDDFTVKSLDFQNKEKISQVELSDRKQELELFKRDYDPIENTFTEAQSKLEKIDGKKDNQFERVDGVWIDKEFNTEADPESVARWQKERAPYVKQLESVRDQRGNMLPQFEDLKKREQEASDKAFKARQDRLKHELGIPSDDGGITARLAREEEKAATGIDNQPIQDVQEVVSTEWADIESSSQEGRDQKALLKVAEQASSEALDINSIISSLPEGSPQVEKALKDFAGALPSSDVSVEKVDNEFFHLNKGGKVYGSAKVVDGELELEIGTFYHNAAGPGDITKLAKGNVRTFINSSERAFDGFDDPDVPLRFEDGEVKNNTQRLSGADEAKHVHEIAQALSQGDLTDEQKVESLKNLGATPAQLMERIDRGLLSINAGHVIGNLLGTNLLATDPNDPKEFDKWLDGNPEIKSRRDKAVKRYLNRTGKDGFNDSAFIKPIHWLGNSAVDVFGSKDESSEISAIHEIDRQFYEDWAKENRSKPGVSFSKLKELYNQDDKNDLQISGWDKIKETWRTSTQNAVGSSVGILAGGVVQAGRLADKGSGLNIAESLGKDEFADSVLKMNNDAFGSWFKGFETNIRRLGKGEGRELDKQANESADSLFELISDRPKYLNDVDSREYQLKIDKAAVKFAQDSYSRIQFVTTELSGGDIGRPSAYDPTRDPQLQAELYAYNRTGNPDHIDRFKALAIMTPSQRGFEKSQSEWMSKNGSDNLLWESVMGGMVAGHQELLIEIGANVSGLALSKAALRAQKFMKVSGRGMAEANTFSAAWRDIGVFKNTLDKPIGKIKSTSNKAVKTAKAVSPGVVAEGAQEGVAELGNPSLTWESATEAIKQGLMGGVGVGGGLAALGKPLALAQDKKEFAARKQQHIDYSKWYNENFKNEPGFAEISHKDVEFADGLTAGEGFNKVHAEFEAAHDGAAAAQAKAIKDPSEENIIAFGQAIDAATNAEAVLGAYNFSSFEAVSEIAAIEDPAQQEFWRGVSKVAVGKTDTLNAKELKAIQGALTDDGSQYFTQVDGVDVLTDEARAEISQKLPSLGTVVRTQESALLETDALDENVDNQELQEAIRESEQSQAAESQESPAQAPVSPLEQGAPNISIDQSISPQEAAQGSQGQSQSIPQDVSALDQIAQPAPSIVGQEVDPSLQPQNTQQSEALQTQGAQSLQDPNEQVQAESQQQQSAENIVSNAVNSFIEATPSFSGDIALDDTTDTNRIASANFDGTITINTKAVSQELQSIQDPVLLQERIAEIFNEEYIHQIQFQAAKGLWEKSGSEGTFEQFLEDYYQNVWEDLTGDQKKATVEAYYGVTFEQWENSNNSELNEPEWKLAAESVRMLVQHRSSGRITELTKAFAKNIPKRILDLLSEALETLKSFSNPDNKVTEAILSIENIINDSAVNETSTNKVSDISNSPLDAGNTNQDNTNTESSDSKKNTVKTALDSALKNTPPIFSQVFADSIKNPQLTPDQIAQRNNITSGAAINILDQVRARLNSALQAQSPEGLTPKKKKVFDRESKKFDEKIEGGSPDLSLGGIDQVAAVDQQRNDEGVRDHVESQKEQRRLAEELIQRDGHDQTLQRLVDLAAAGETFHSVDVAASQIIIANESRRSSHTIDQEVKLAEIINAYRDVGTRTARDLALRRDPYMNRSERVSRFIMETFYSVDAKTKAAVDNAKSNKERSEIFKNFIKKSKKTRADLKRSGIDIDASVKEYNKARNNKEKAFRENPELANVVTINVNKVDEQTKAVVETVIQGAFQGTEKRQLLENAAEAAGIPVSQAVKKYLKFQKTIKDTSQEAAAKITSKALSAGPINANFDLDAIGLIDITDAFDENGKVKKSYKPKKQNTPDGVIDLNSPKESSDLSKDLSARNATLLEKALEWRKMSLLTGLRTHAVNTASNVGYISYENGPIRLAKTSINHTLEILGWKDKDLKLPRFGDVKALHKKHLVNAIVRGAQNAAISWKSGDRVFYDQVMDIVKEVNTTTGFKEDQFAQALNGKVAGILRKLSFGALTTADEFTSSIIGSVEATAHASRIASKEGLRGAEFDARMTELLQHGSISWEHGVEKARMLTFQQEISEISEGEQKPAIDDVIDRAALVIKKWRRGVRKKDDTLSVVSGAVAETFIPFVDTPANIAKTTLKVVPQSGLVGIGIDLLRATSNAAKTYRDEVGDASTKEQKQAAVDKATEEFNKIYDRTRLVEDLAYQAVGWSVYFAFKGLMNEYGDDDLPFMTGTLPHTQESKNELNQSYHTYMGPGRIRIGKWILEYGRLEPIGSQLMLTVDFLNEEDTDAASVVGKIVSLTRDKTYMKGISDIIQLASDIGTVATTEDDDYENERAKSGLARLTSNYVGSFIPNILKQPFRENTELITEDNINSDDHFFKKVGSGIIHNVLPFTSNSKIGVFGKEIERNPGDPIFNVVVDKVLRAITPVKYSRNAEVDDRVVYIQKYLKENKGDQERVKKALSIYNNPSRTIRRTIKGKKVKYKMTADEYNAYSQEFRLAASKRLGHGWDTKKVNDGGVDLMIRAISESKAKTKEKFIRKNIKKILDSQDK